MVALLSVASKSKITVLKARQYMSLDESQDDNIRTVLAGVKAHADDYLGQDYSETCVPDSVEQWVLQMTARVFAAPENGLNSSSGPAGSISFGSLDYSLLFPNWKVHF